MKKIWIILWSAIVILSLFLRLKNLNGISFSYDQARDAFYAQDILNKDFKIVGPPTDIQGVFHGPLYYYTIAPIYAISGDPRHVVLFFTFLNITSGLLLANFVFRVTKNKFTTLFFYFLFAISPELVFYSRFISNVSLVIPSLSLAIFSSLFLPRQIAFVGMALGLGLAAQSEFFLLSLFFLALAYFAFRKDKPKNILHFLITYLFTIVSYFLVEIKFNFRGLNSFLNFSNNTEFSLTQFLERFVSGYSRLFSRNIFDFHNAISIVIFFLVIFWFIKEIKSKRIDSKLVFLLYLFLSPLILMFFVSPNPIFFTISATIPLLIILSIFLATYPTIIPLVFIFATLNAYPIYHNGIETNGDYTGSEIGQVLSDEMKVVDLVSNLGKDTSYNSVTAPMFTNTLWSYLFSWYGQSKYGFVPTWHGTSQTGMVGDKVVTLSTGNEKNSVLIVDAHRVPSNWQVEYKIKESYYSNLYKTEYIGIYEVLLGNRKK